MHIGKTIAVQNLVHFILILWIPWVGFWVSRGASSFEEVVPTWEGQGHQVSLLHGSHHVLCRQVCRAHCALHTCRHRDHHRRNSRSTAQRPTKWWDFGLAPTVRSSPTGRLTPKYFKQGSTSAMLWKKAEGCRDLPWWTHGKSLQPPAPCLANFDRRNTATTVDKMVRFLFVPTVRSSPTGRLIATYFNLESTRAMLSKKADGSLW